jgi:hypothetical protein
VLATPLNDRRYKGLGILSITRPLSGAAPFMIFAHSTTPRSAATFPRQLLQFQNFI